MLPFILLLLFVQSLYATDEFPTLMKRAQLSWNGFDLSSKLDAKQTVGTDGEVTNFVFCGPFENFGRDGNCTYTYEYDIELTSERDCKTTTGSGSTPARLISAKNYTYQCYSVSNPVPDFVKINSQTMLYCPIRWNVKYNCYENKEVQPPFVPDYKMIAIVMAVLLVIVGFCTYKVGEKRGADGALGNSAADYSSSFANPASANSFGKTA